MFCKNTTWYDLLINTLRRNSKKSCTKIENSKYNENWMSSELLKNVKQWIAIRCMGSGVVSSKQCNVMQNAGQFDTFRKKVFFLVNDASMHVPWGEMLISTSTVPMLAHCSRVKIAHITCHAMVSNYAQLLGAHRQEGPLGGGAHVEHDCIHLYIHRLEHMRFSIQTSLKTTHNRFVLINMSFVLTDLSLNELSTTLQLIHNCSFSAWLVIITVDFHIFNNFWLHSSSLAKKALEGFCVDRS